MSTLPRIARSNSRCSSGVAPTGIQTTRSAARSAVATREALATAATLFGGGALLLAVLGIYGSIAQSAKRRRREMGIRLAIGAQTRDLFSLVLSDGFRLAAAGISIGLLASFTFMRFIRGFLWGINLPQTRLRSPLQRWQR
ncbi:MAG: FtsX-like permease family protein [Longimicrobiales bacterium]